MITWRDRLEKCRAQFRDVAFRCGCGQWLAKMLVVLAVADTGQLHLLLAAYIGLFIRAMLL